MKDRKLNRYEKQVLELFKKADRIASERKIDISIFGNAGYCFYVLDNHDDSVDTHWEMENGVIDESRVLFTSKNIIGDGGDCDPKNRNENNMEEVITCPDCGSGDIEDFE